MSQAAITAPAVINRHAASTGHVNGAKPAATRTSVDNSGDA
jgi:hypothetical protein